MRILISCLSFGSLTGSELYVFELAKELAKNHDVHVLAKHTSRKFIELGLINGFNVVDIPPNYFIGDGKRKYIQDGKEEVTKSDVVYKISNNKFDLILLNHAKVGWDVDIYYKDTPIINIIHSEIIPRFEDPIIHPNVKGYIAIRQSIKDHLVENFKIEEDKIEVIGNPVDTDRFNTENTADDGFILFVGSYDHLRRGVIYDLIYRAKQESRKLVLIGRNMTKYTTNKDETHVKKLEPIILVEDFVKRASYVASIKYGRTAIEGYLCGKNALLYEVDDYGNIIDSKMTSISPQVAYGRHDPKIIAERIINYGRKQIRLQ